MNTKQETSMPASIAALPDDLQQHYLAWLKGGTSPEKAAESALEQHDFETRYIEAVNRPGAYDNLE